jgi:uncharacterized membrane protein
MVDERDQSTERDNMPFVAPCRHVPTYAPWFWLSEGFADLRKAPVPSLAYGVFMSALIMMVVGIVWHFGSSWLVFSLLCGFVFIAPLTCIGIYAISAQLERNQPVSMKRTLRAAFKRYLGTEMVFALVLLVIFLLWARAASVASIFFPAAATPDLAEMLPYSIAVASVGVLFLGITFAASIFALPMIMHRNVDAITAIVTSLNSVSRNKLAMLFWVGLILVGLVLGILTAGIGLVFFLPAVGHGVWHGYLDTIDAEQFPRHREGITSIARTDAGQSRFRIPQKP